jgi:hypothetical protein
MIERIEIPLRRRRRKNMNCETIESRRSERDRIRMEGACRMRRGKVRLGVEVHHQSHFDFDLCLTRWIGRSALVTERAVGN